MDIYNRKQQWKLLLFIFAVLIGVSSLWYTNQLVSDLAIEEQKKVKLWAEATRRLADISLDNQDLDFLVDVLTNNTTIPVMWVDANENINAQRNLDSLRSKNPEYLKKQLEKMKSENQPIPMDLGEGNVNYIYYRNSYLLRQLSYYPYLQLGIILLFILIAYFAFSTARKAEQNQVWLGLSKETAHQLGTPTSSLLAWVELLKEKQPDNELITELENDVNRLEIITERFSKIGSKPILKNENIVEILNNSVRYLKTRTSDQITFVFTQDQDLIRVPVNLSLFEWVIENICKNAIDATEGKGTITLSIKENANNLFLDVHDTGKGIPKSKQKTIFKPGYTTKKRGWGLGLSLAKRIIESYHDGKIFVHQSDPQKGTIIRMVLKTMN
ncbi:MAG: HAMP domain-containing histidine kinase [Bacteroidales bacterium]|nr:HAMP domain-containing histidine kinase [Bacteroidales bacterium]